MTHHVVIVLSTFCLQDPHLFFQQFEHAMLVDEVADVTGQNSPRDQRIADFRPQGRGCNSRRVELDILKSFDIKYLRRLKTRTGSPARQACEDSDLLFSNCRKAFTAER